MDSPRPIGAHPQKSVDMFSGDELRLERNRKLHG
jgi:hypothetical protein